MVALVNEHQSYQDIDGKPIVNGFVYIGLKKADTKTNLLSIFSDRELSSALANPQRTDAFGKTSTKIWVEGQHSLLVEDENNVQKLSDQDAGETAAVGNTTLSNVQGINAITAAASPTITAYVDKQTFIFTVVASNTGPVTLDIDGVGAKAIVDASGGALIAGTLISGQLSTVNFNGTGDNFQLLVGGFSGTLGIALDTNGFPIDTSRSTIASSATTSDIFADNVGNEIDFTGTATVTDFPNASRAGAKRILHCAAACVFTNNATLFVMGAANYTAAAGDVVEVHAITVSTFRLTILKANGEAVFVVPPPEPAFESQLFHVEDQKAAAAPGGTFTGGAFQTRALNSIRTNEITGASLSANLITLPIGVFYVEAQAPASKVNTHQASLANTSGTTVNIVGSAAYSFTTNTANALSIVTGRFTTSVITVVQLRHRCSATRATDGFGLANNNVGNVNIFSVVKIWKVG